jgi:ATP-dependent RNA helicase SUPV3L1/SUV3
MQVLNLERPDKWFELKSFCNQRTFIYHHGPTNSGKSTAAIEDLKSLSSKERGIYMAPLRLLAWEYQQKLGNCTLITGQEKEYKNSNLISCTI